MFLSLFLIAFGASAAYGDMFNVTVGADGRLAYNPPFVKAMPGDVVNFIFYPKNHTVTQSSFDQPCTPLDGGFDSEFKPVAPGTTDLPTWQMVVNDTDTSIWIHCKQQMGNHCGEGMVFAINPPDEGTFDAFQARANATLNTSATDTATSVWTTPSPQPWATATATVTNGTSVWTTTYTSYLGSLPPSPAPRPVDHRIIVGVNGTLAYDPPNIIAAIGDTVTFEFHPKNHTATQSSFSDPCHPLQQSTGIIGFNSDFHSVNTNETNFPTFQIPIEDTAPIWGYCGQPGHCEAGMVFAINAVEDGPNSFENYVELAKRTGTNSTTTTSAPTATGSSSNGNAASLSAPIPLKTICFLLLAAMML